MTLTLDRVPDALTDRIKDFASSKVPERADEIKRQFFGLVISSHIENAQVKACAHRATWLGNDETHYVKKWETKDIEDLKQLIRLTETWILNVILTEKFSRTCRNQIKPHDRRV